MKNVKIVGFIAALVIVGVVILKNYMEREAVLTEDSAVVIERVTAQNWEVRPVGETGLTTYTPDELKKISP